VDTNVGNHRVIDYGTKVLFAQSVWEAVRTSFVGHVGGTSEQFAQEFPLQNFRLALKLNPAPSTRLLARKSSIHRALKPVILFFSLSQFLYC
jgi:hypothetical protein